AQGQAGVVNDRRQDVVELMGHAAGQRPHAAEFLRLQQLLAELVCLAEGEHDGLADHFWSPPDLSQPRGPAPSPSSESSHPSAAAVVYKGISASPMRHFIRTPCETCNSVKEVGAPPQAARRRKCLHDGK